jgi:hypothetical protein
LNSFSNTAALIEKLSRDGHSIRHPVVDEFTIFYLLIAIDCPQKSSFLIDFLRKVQHLSHQPKRVPFQKNCGKLAFGYFCDGKGILFGRIMDIFILLSTHHNSSKEIIVIFLDIFFGFYDLLFDNEDLSRTCDLEMILNACSVFEHLVSIVGLGNSSSSDSPIVKIGK